MKNPLPATLWFLRHDAVTGLLEENGFSLNLHSDGKEKVYSKDGFSLFCDGFWFDLGTEFLVYRNPSRSFYRLPKNKDPMCIPGRGEERVRLRDGFKQVESFLNEHEAFVSKKKGTAYRPGLMQKMPRAEQRYAKNWKLVFRCESRAHLTLAAKPARN